MQNVSLDCVGLNHKHHFFFSFVVNFFFPMENEIFVFSVSLRVMLISILLYESMLNLLDLIHNATSMKCFNFYRDITYLWSSYMVRRIKSFIFGNILR